MIFDFTVLLFLTLLSLAASTVNGGLGYGYSSLSTPLAILVIINRIINPVYVLVEGMMNSVMLVLSGKANIKSTTKRVLPIIAALVPAAIVGSIALAMIAPVWVRFLVYAMILPLILLQAAGFRRPIKNERTAGVPLGMGVGLLYSITTISGPPIALFWNNQGMVKSEFKAAIAQIRIVESVTTIVAYSFLGLFTATTFQLFTYVAPPILIGIPLGFLIVRRIGAEVFRRICMSFDAWIVGYGLAVVLGGLFGLVEFGYAVWALVIGIDLMLLYRFFSKRRRLSPVEEAGLLTPRVGPGPIEVPKNVPVTIVDPSLLPQNEAEGSND
jgi:uncharacterized membrane protein YfcA